MPVLGWKPGDQLVCLVCTAYPARGCAKPRSPIVAIFDVEDKGVRLTGNSGAASATT